MEAEGVIVYGWNGGGRPCTRIHLLNKCVHTLEENEIKSAELAPVPSMASVGFWVMVDS
jgi:hypothetical protein